MWSKEKIEQEFFNGNRCIRVDWEIEGQKITEDGSIIIGERAGPSSYRSSYQISNLIHEMSHFVEIDDARMKQYGWGLIYPEVWVIDRMCMEPRTMQITERELRVVAFQANVLKYIGHSDDVENIISSFRYLPDFTFVPIEDGSSAYGEGRTHDLDYKQITESQIKWLINRAEDLRSIHTLDLFMSEWERKSKAI